MTSVQPDSGATYILDTPLPDNRNFAALKALGLEYIQQLSGRTWSDYNESDPGITILDQLCYALTELGYCNDFPLADILTRADGTIDYANQFFAPDTILTTAPVTTQDYAALLLDRIGELDAVYFSACEGGSPADGYEVWLALSPQATAQQALAAPTVAFNVLNEYRNLGECFRLPVVLLPLPLTLSGRIAVAAGSTPARVLAGIQAALQAYAVPPVRRSGYSALAALGVTSDRIFNGPQLGRGWIDGAVPPDRRSVVLLDEVLRLVSAVDGVAGVDSLTLAGADGAPADRVPLDPQHVARFTVGADTLVFTQAQGPADGNVTPLHAWKEQHAATPVHAVVDTAPPLPTGRYRNIADYYSIQNTFPTQYAIGYDSVQFSAPPFRIAQSRQLKGYLMVFDQLLANQFSQLAEVGTLFSFRAHDPVAPTADAWLTGLPPALLPPTYFSQPLYHVPDVQPLLRGSEAYRFGEGGNVLALRTRLDWEEYKQDPFNAYASGLRAAMENPENLTDRWNRVLDHLLARHGIGGDYPDAAIVLPQWLGSEAQTRMLVKRFLLQNFQTLSYHRNKARNYLAADPLQTPGRYRLTSVELGRLRQAGFSEALLGAVAVHADTGFSSRAALLLTLYRALEWTSSAQERKAFFAAVQVQDTAREFCDTRVNDGRLDLDLLQDAKRVAPADLRNHASIELLADLTLNLGDHYRTLVSLLTKLLARPAFVVWLRAADDGVFLAEDDLRVERSGTADTLIVDSQPLLIVTHEPAGRASEARYRAHVDQLLWLALFRKGMLLIEEVLLGAARNPAVPPRVRIVLPDWVMLTASVALRQSLDVIGCNFWPLHIGRQLQPAGFDALQALVDAYIPFHNALRAGIEAAQPQAVALAAALAALDRETV